MAYVNHKIIPIDTVQWGEVFSAKCRHCEERAEFTCSHDHFRREGKQTVHKEWAFCRNHAQKFADAFFLSLPGDLENPKKEDVGTGKNDDGVPREVISYGTKKRVKKSFRIPGLMLDQLEHEAAQEGLPLTAYVVHLLHTHPKRKK